MEEWTVGLRIAFPSHLFPPFFCHSSQSFFEQMYFPLNEENMLPYDHFNAEDIIELKGVCLLPFTRARPRPRVVSCRTWPRK